jgi:hypothetical protein
VSSWALCEAWKQRLAEMSKAQLPEAQHEAHMAEHLARCQAAAFGSQLVGAYAMTSYCVIVPLYVCCMSWLTVVP